MGDVAPPGGGSGLGADGEDSGDLIDIPFEVRPHEHGLRADLFLTHRIKRMSRSKAAALIRAGMMHRGAAVLDRPAQRVFAGDPIVLKRKPLPERPIDDVVLPVVAEAEDYLAVNKPGDLVVHPTASSYHRTLIRVLRVRRPGEYLDLAHRIDKETSGVVLLARNERAAARLKTDFAERRVEKSYLAIVRGEPREDAFVIDRPMRLQPDSVSGVLMEIGGEGALAAVTDVRVLRRGCGVALVEARPHTGRQHQIRLHLAHVGHPLVGDKLYLGGEELFIRSLNGAVPEDELLATVGHPRHALHAHRLAFRHPVTMERVELCAPLSDDLAELAARLGLEP